MLGLVRPHKKPFTDTVNKSKGRLTERDSKYRGYSRLESQWVFLVYLCIGDQSFEIYQMEFMIHTTLADSAVAIARSFLDLDLGVVIKLDFNHCVSSYSLVCQQACNSCNGDREGLHDWFVY